MPHLRVILARMEPEMDIVNKFITPGIVLLLTLASGIWLSSSGKPLNTTIFTIHKLIALGVVILTSIQYFNLLKNMEAQASTMILIGVAGLGVLALFASGALMSIGKLNYGLLLLVHRIALFLMIVTTGMSVYFLDGRLS
jgi:hypothetical protein